MQFWWLASELFQQARGILNKYAQLFWACCPVFPRHLLKELLNRAGEMSVVLIFGICNVYEIAAYDWLYSQYSGCVKMVDMASKFLGNIEYWRLLLDY